ncbi:MAG: 4a-hydroxytetrahydrobiopterin dehydratase [Planctomycetaceae bacterium]|jgi:4a-hydroxytetrahydrobiopterin dehydratase
MTAEQAAEQLRVLDGWSLKSEPDRLCKEYRVRDFQEGLLFFNRICAVAEQEAHHPDLHLVSYRNLTVEIWTHAIQGLSLNDFILAARIDQLPVEIVPANG